MALDRPLRTACIALALAVFLGGQGPIFAQVAQDGAPPAGGGAAAPAREIVLAVAPVGAVHAGAGFELAVSASGLAPGERLPAEILLDDRPVHRLVVTSDSREIEIPVAPGTGSHELALVAGHNRATVTVRAFPGWLSVVPPLVAILLALLFKDVVLSLFLGVFSGALIVAGWNPATAFARSIDTYVAPALADLDHAKILIFSSLLGGMVGVISKSGGTLGIVERLQGFARTARRGQMATWLMGVAIFFDDYANTLIVGSTMRPISDRLRLSREKLAYMVDSTAAPVASLVPISTWIGFEIGLIGAAFATLGLDANAYTTFVATIPYRFYPVFALVLGFTIAASGKDLGPMLRAERRARHTAQVLAPGDTPLADYSTAGLAPPEGIPHRATNAVLPIVAVVVVTLTGLYVTGAAAVERAAGASTLTWLRDVFAASNSYDALLWASLAGVVVAIALPLLQRILPLKDAVEGMVEGFKAMLLAFVVLILAWSIQGICTDLGTADYLVDLTSGTLPPHLLPVLVFVLAAATSFATGSSWGTMGILLPLVIPIAHGLSIAAGMGPEGDTYWTLMLGTISSVLAGSVWGDHCSPISDTTILSSMASGADHIAHVRTQLPYALSIGVLGMVIGDIPTAYGMSPWISLAVGSVVIVGAMLWWGKRAEDGAALGVDRPV